MTLTDWLPSGGRLYETNRGVCYVDDSPLPSAWPLTGPRELPNSLLVPENYVVLAVGGGEMLLQSTESASRFPVYRMGLP